MLRRASLRASPRIPACRCSAPQQPWPSGTTTSQPLRCSTRTVASFSRAKLTLAMHPARNATRCVRSPSGGKCAADLAEEERRLGRRCELLQIAQAAQQLHLSHAARQRLEAADLEEVEQRAGHREGPARLQQVHEHQTPQLAREPAPMRVRLQFGARIFHHAAVAYARRAGGFAAPAGQAKIDVLTVGLADSRAVGHLDHLIDAAARRIHLEAEFAIGGAGVQTQAAMHAAVQVELPRSQIGIFR